MKYGPCDQNGSRVYRQVRRDPDGTWSANVWFGYNPVTILRRYYGYRTREAARNADISDEGMLLRMRRSSHE